MSEIELESILENAEQNLIAQRRKLDDVFERNFKGLVGTKDVILGLLEKMKEYGLNLTDIDRIDQVLQEKRYMLDYCKDVNAVKTLLFEIETDISRNLEDSLIKFSMMNVQIVQYYTHDTQLAKSLVQEYERIKSELMESAKLM